MCAECDEVNVPLRRAEKRFLNDLNQKVRYPPPKKEVVRTPADKVKTGEILAGCASGTAVDFIRYLCLVS